MKQKRNWMTLAWVFVGLLALAGVLISLGRREGRARPTLDNFAPSGAAAFADLLRTSGYRVTHERSNAPVLHKGDLIVSFFNEDLSEEEDPVIFKRLQQFMKDGGRVLMLPMGPDFSAQSAEVATGEARPTVGGKSLPVKLRSYNPDPTALGIPGGGPHATVWKLVNPDEKLATVQMHGDGVLAILRDGLIGTNRFIDQGQNADVLMSMVALLAPKGSRVVFTEATFDPSDPDLLEMLGPWAQAAWWQILFLFLVIVYSLGKRFGLPEEYRPAQFGQRELVNAVADTYQRAKATAAASRAIYERSDIEVRRALKLSSDAPPSERDLRIPPALALEFQRVNESAQHELPVSEAFHRCRSLRKQVRMFLAKN